ncbi:MAG TPA: c-type cytochrome [Gammaproteobacteria bacterium]|nr:c-type cytochrome [Gammaproteobacteria bacterium]
MKNWLAITITLIISAAHMTAQAAGDPEAGKTKSAACAACHGADGNSLNPEWPKLAGQHESYIVKQLAYFSDGERENATMKPMAGGLTEQDREDLGAYYASQTVSPASADPALVELGEKIYRSGNPESGIAPCMGCHGPNGAGNPAARYPALRGQHAKYIENQLHGFAEGKRVNENAVKMMQILASRMTNREIRAVASYIQGLH